MKKILFATTNPAKIQKYQEGLRKKDIDLITINDINVKLNIDENGKNAIENAYIKAKAYYEATGIVSVGMDNNLFLEEVNESEQPGTHVRRINGKELNDEEMIEYYTNLAKKYGGKLTAKWVYGMVIYDGKEAREYTWNKSHFYLVDKACSKRRPGYPLDSISVAPESNKYWLELKDEEKNDINDSDDVIEFIVKSCK